MSHTFLLVNRQRTLRHTAKTMREHALCAVVLKGQVMLREFMKAQQDFGSNVKWRTRFDGYDGSAKDSNERPCSDAASNFTFSMVLEKITLKCADCTNKGGWISKQSKKLAGAKVYHAICFTVLNLNLNLIFHHWDWTNTFITDRKLSLNITKMRRVEEKKDGEREE